MAVPSGCSRLDRTLKGGLPENRTVLVTGGPAVGKTTLAMQFLQEGLDRGERCVYICTEQTEEELRSAFDSFEFELDNPNLTITSIHAAPGKPIEDSETGLTLRELGGASAGGPYDVPFEREFLLEHLADHGPCDRVVLDSISGLGVISEDEHHFRQVVLDIIRLFTDTYEATAMFTAEGGGFEQGGESRLSSMLQFTANGVVRMYWDHHRGSRRRFLQVAKMRGVDHDTRSFEVNFEADGIHLTPVARTVDLPSQRESIISTHLEGLDDLAGGVLRGHSVLLEYDGRATVDGLVAQMIHAAWAEDMCVWLINSPTMGPERLRDMLPAEWDLEELLDNDRLFLMDMFAAWRELHDHANVFYAPSGLLGSLFRRSRNISFYLEKKVAGTIDSRRTAPMLGVAYTEALLRWLSPEDVKESYYWSRERLAERHDTGMFIHNPATMPEELSEFFYSDSLQVFEAAMAETGIQYVHLNKSPIGEPGSMAVMDYVDGELVIRHSG
jgi:KaiC/GvpD/RAD55 family RecA-like ATPase